MNMPIPYEVENLIASCFSPGDVQLRNNASYRFFCRYLWDKILENFTYKIPETFGLSLFKAALFANGCVAVFYTDEYGLTAQWGVPGGYTVNYDPRYVLVTNPKLPGISGRQLEIGTDCAVLRINDHWRGVTDIVSYYAQKMALASQAVDVNLINSKVAFVFAAKDRQQAQSFKKMFDGIATGKPAVVVDKTLFNEDGEVSWKPFVQNIKQEYIAGDLMNDLHKIEEEFNTRIGIPNANTDKRERLITDEVNANNVETSILAAGWLDHIKRGADMVREMYGAEIVVDWRYEPNVLPNANSDRPESRDA